MAVNSDSDQIPAVSALNQTQATASGVSISSVQVVWQLIVYCQGINFLVYLVV